jgi:ferredoxin
MKLLILYFSGTGNTDYVAHYLADKLEPLPIEIQLCSVEQQPAEALADFDVLAIGFPVYGCEAPPFFQSYLEKLPPGAGRGAFVFCTKGAWAGNAVRHNLRRLAERGYVPLRGGSVVMPGSDGLAFVRKDSWMARAALQKDFDHLKAADRLAQRMAVVLSGLVAGAEEESFRRPLPFTIAGALFDGLWAFLYDLFGNRLRTRFWADKRCVGCGLCARICPVDNVELCDGHSCFGEHCILCMRCIHACPQEAIQIGRATIDKFRWRGPKGRFKPLRLRPVPAVVHQEEETVEPAFAQQPAEVQTETEGG